MAIELSVSVVVTAALAAMIVGEWGSVGDGRRAMPAGWRSIACRADVLLAGCIVVCNAILWLPLLFR